MKCTWHAHPLIVISIDLKPSCLSMLSMHSCFNAFSVPWVAFFASVTGGWPRAFSTINAWSICSFSVVPKTDGWLRPISCATDRLFPLNCWFSMNQFRSWGRYVRGRLVWKSLSYVQHPSGINNSLLSFNRLTNSWYLPAPLKWMYYKALVSRPTIMA